MASRCRSAAIAAVRSAAARSKSIFPDPASSRTAASLVGRSSRPPRNPATDLLSPCNNSVDFKIPSSIVAVSSPCRSLLSQGYSRLPREHFRWYMIGRHPSSQFSKHNKEYRLTLYSVRTSTSNYSTQASGAPKEGSRKDISKVEDPFDAPTYNIPEKPVTFAEGASYTIVIVAGLGVAALAAYAVFKELIFEPKEYKIFGKALQRVQNDSQVSVRIGSPVTGYGQETRNRAARQRIANRVWKDEDGVEHVEVNFYIRGPHGAGKVYTEMFKDSADKNWKFTYLIVEITSPSHAQLMLESYVPA